MTIADFTHPSSIPVPRDCGVEGAGWLIILDRELHVALINSPGQVQAGHCCFLCVQRRGGPCSGMEEEGGALVGM